MYLTIPNTLVCILLCVAIPASHQLFRAYSCLSFFMCCIVSELEQIADEFVKQCGSRTSQMRLPIFTSILTKLGFQPELCTQCFKWVTQSNFCSFHGWLANCESSNREAVMFMYARYDRIMHICKKIEPTVICWTAKIEPLKNFPHYTVSLSKLTGKTSIVQITCAIV